MNVACPKCGQAAELTSARRRCGSCQKLVWLKLYRCRQCQIVFTANGQVTAGLTVQTANGPGRQP